VEPGAARERRPVDAAHRRPRGVGLQAVRVGVVGRGAEVRAGAHAVVGRRQDEQRLGLSGEHAALEQPEGVAQPQR
jgi:hypothetical protein